MTKYKQVSAVRRQNGQLSLSVLSVRSAGHVIQVMWFFFCRLSCMSLMHTYANTQHAPNMETNRSEHCTHIYSHTLCKVPLPGPSNPADPGRHSRSLESTKGNSLPLDQGCSRAHSRGTAKPHRRWGQVPHTNPDPCPQSPARAPAWRWSTHRTPSPPQTHLGAARLLAWYLCLPAQTSLHPPAHSQQKNTTQEHINHNNEGRTRPQPRVDLCLRSHRLPRTGTNSTG